MTSVPYRIEVPQIVKSKLSGVRRRRTGLRLVEAIVIPLGVLLAAMLLVMAVDWMLESGSGWRVITTGVALLAGGAAAAWAVLRLLRVGRTLSSAAHDVDRAVPSLGERWSTITELSESSDPLVMKGAPSLIGKVSDEAAAMAHLVAEGGIVSRKSAYRWGGACAGTVALVLLAFAIWPLNMVMLMQRFFAPLSDLPFTRVTSLTGSRDVPKFEPLTVEAGVEGKSRGWASLEIRGADKKVSEIALVHDDADPTKYKHTFRSVDEPLEYRIESGDGRTAWHTITPIERPSFSQIRFKVTPPDYTRLAVDQKDTLPRTYRAVEGSRLELEFLASKPLKEMKLQSGKDRTIELTRGEGNWYRYATSLKESVTLSTNMTDKHGLSNLTPATSNITVYADQAPTVSITAPVDAMALPPDDTLQVEFTAADDFGFTKAELVVEISPAPAEDAQTAKASVAADVEKDAAKDAAKAESSKGQKDQNANSKSSKQPAGDGEKPLDSDAQASAEKSSADGENEPTPDATKPLTKVIPIALDPKDPQKNLRKTVDLDLKPFKLKTGQQVSYSVRVTDSRMAEASSTGSPQQKSPGQPGEPQQAQASKDDANKPGQSGESQQAEASKADADKPTPAEAMASKQSPSQSPGGGKPKSSTQPSNPSQNSDNRIAQKSHPAKESKNKGGDSPNKSEIPPKPQDNVTTRWAPFPNSTSSSKRSIKVDEWAGTAANDLREKLEIAIDKFLADLDAALAAAQKPTDALKLHVTQKLNWTEPQDAQLAAARKSIADASGVVSEAMSKTAGTPYAFMGLQLGDIGVSHVDPARKHLSSASTLTDNVLKQQPELERASYHIAQARIRLANLTREYEAVKKDNQLADAMQHLKKLHQLYVKDMMALLMSGKPKLNPLNRKIQEIPEDLAAKLNELAEASTELKKKLAEALAKDPDLLKRLMAKLRQEGINLRDVYTLQERQQQEQLHQLAEWMDTPPDRRQDLEDQLRAKEVAAAAETAENAVRLDDNVKTWVPRKVDATQGSLAKVQELSMEIALAATESAVRLTEGRDSDSTDAANLAADKIRSLNAALDGALLQHPGDEMVKRYVDFRKVESARLTVRLGLFIERSKALRAGDFARYARIEQTRLMTETLELQTKLLPVGQMYAGVPAIRDKAKQLNEEMTRDVIDNQQIASTALADRSLEAGRDGENRAVAGYASSSKTFDELRKLIVDYEDAKGLPPMAGGGMPSVEALLAQLEIEKKVLEGLLDCMPVNVAATSDWMMPGEGLSGSGMNGEIGTSAAQASKRAKDASQRLGNARSGAPPQGTATLPPGKEGRVWDTYVSQLQKDLRQVRGNSLPDEYRQAIEEYMRIVADQTSSGASRPQR